MLLAFYRTPFFFLSYYIDEIEKKKKRDRSHPIAVIMDTQRHYHSLLLPSIQWEFHAPHTQLFAFWMSPILLAADAVHAVTASRAGYGFSTRLTHANKIPVFKVNKNGSQGAQSFNFVRFGALRIQGHVAELIYPCQTGLSAGLVRTLMLNFNPSCHLTII